MKACKILPMAALVLFWSGAALAQDAVKVDPAHYKVVFENPSVRVLKIDYPAGAKSTMHQHPDTIVVPMAATMHQHPDTIVVPMAASKVRFTTPDGKSEDLDMVSESALYAPAVTHNPSNIGTGRIDGILVEFKAAAPGTATLPTSRPGMSMKMLAEGPRAIAFRTTADPTFQEPAGSKHDFDQIVIALGPSQMTLSIDGKPAKTTWARGDAQFIGRGVPHESKNAGGKPIDFIIVAIK